MAGRTVNGKRIAVGLAQYAAVVAGQAVIAWSVQQGVARVNFELDQRKRRKNRVGFVK